MRLQVFVETAVSATRDGHRQRGSVIARTETKKPIAAG